MLNGVTRSYAYDLDGNRTSRIDAGVTITYTYDRADELINRSDPNGSNTFGYDAFGNLTTSATSFNTATTYTYDAANRLGTITLPGGGNATSSFTYDGLGRLLTHTPPGVGAPVETYAYVGTSQTIWQISSSAATTSATIAPSGQRLAIASGSSFAFPLADLHANLSAALNNAESSVTTALRYDGFGDTIASSNTSGLQTYWKYQGRYDANLDPNDPLYANGARFYDPGIAAFTQLDSMLARPATR